VGCEILSSKVWANAVKTTLQKHAQKEDRPCTEIQSLDSANMAPQRGRRYRSQPGTSCVEIVDVTL